MSEAEEGAGPVRRPRRLDRLAIAALLAMALIVAYQTIAPPPVGLADNGDFARLAGPLGLRATVTDRSKRYFGFLLPGFRMTAPFWRSRYGTSENVPVLAARAAGAVVSKTEYVDIRAFGAANALFTLAGAAVLLAATRRWPPWARIPLALLAVVAYTDVGYVAAFNSLYSQTAALWTFLFLAGFALLAIDRPTPFARAGYWTSALLFVTAKPQEVVQAPILALLGVLLTSEAEGPAARRWRAGALGVGLCAAAALYFVRIPRAISAPGMHNEVFVEILGASADPAADLRELGLPAEWIAYRGLNPNDRRSPAGDRAFRAEFLRRVRPARIAGFWARHPRRARALLLRCLRHSLQMRPPELGNFREIDGGPPLARSRAFAFWSGWKGSTDHSLRWILPVLAAAALSGLGLALRGRSLPARRRGVALVALVLMAGVELVVPVFAQGAWGIERVLYGFHVMFDFCVIVLAALASGVVASAASRFAAGAAARPRT